MEKNMRGFRLYLIMKEPPTYARSWMKIISANRTQITMPSLVTIENHGLEVVTVHWGTYREM